MKRKERVSPLFCLVCVNADLLFVFCDLFKLNSAGGSSEQRIVFSGNATEAIGMFPTKVNVAVAASLASVGPENMQVSIQSTPGFVGDTQKVEIKNDQVHAVVEGYSATSDIAGWSVVNTLINITSPIVF